MSAVERLVTAEEFARMPESSHYQYELVEGRLVRMSRPNFDHGRIVVQLAHLLKTHLEKQPEGVAVVESGFILASDPDTVRGPDVSFVRQGRVPSRGHRGFPRMAPDAVFEVLSPDDRAGEMRAKIADYLDRGVGVAVVVDPRDRAIVVHRPGAQPATLRDADDVVDLADAIPGFTCRVSEIFE
jgi:Uma2 family endonuclease